VSLQLQELFSRNIDLVELEAIKNLIFSRRWKQADPFCMRRESREFLFDIDTARRAVRDFTEGKVFNDDEGDLVLISAVERHFEIIGEALSRLHRVDPEIAEQIPEYQRIIAFRNILIHGYAAIQNHTVWGVVRGYLPALANRIEHLLSHPD
jgi:uncharacterized protein with HEPN domain